MPFKVAKWLVMVVVPASMAGCAIAPPIEAPVAPDPIVHSVEVPVERRSSRLDAAKYVQTGLENAPLVASKVVININTDVRTKIYCIERFGVDECGGGRKGDGSVANGAGAEKANDIDTTAFVSDTERQLEKELIKKGFRVINRARLEAKLREMRDGRDDCKGNWSHISPDCLNQLPREAQDLLAFYNAEHKAKRLDDAEFLRKTSDLREKYQYSSAGKKRDANEMTDVSEVIRAAKDGEVGADYIMLVNGFSLGSQRRVIDLLSYGQVKEFVSRAPSIEPLVRAKQYVECYNGVVSLDASLIHVKSGEVVWIGGHGVAEDMLAADGHALTLSLMFNERVENTAEVEMFVRANNTEEARKLRASNDSQVQLPAWRWLSKLDLNVVSGRCAGRGDTSSLRPNLQGLTELVARELIATIRTQSGQPVQALQ